MRMSRILVDVDAVAARHPALDRAIELAERCRASVTIIDVLPEVPRFARRTLTKPLERELVAHRTERLQAMIDRLRGGPKMTMRLLRGRRADALVREAARGRASLLMRTHGLDAAGARPPFGVIDMQLLRACPCPVWIVHAEDGRPRRIAAAVHANAFDATEQALNRRILELARLLCDFEGASLTILQAWSVFGAELLANRMSRDEFRKVGETIRREAETQLAALVRKAGLRFEDVPRVLVHGEPEHAIPRYIRDHGVDLVVMGTVGRRGLAGAVMGNTAERVLGQLRGSVVAVKPPGFRVRPR